MCLTFKVSPENKKQANSPPARCQVLVCPGQLGLFPALQTGAARMGSLWGFDGDRNQTLEDRRVVGFA